MQRIRDLKEPSESEGKYTNNFRARAGAYVDAWNAGLGISSDEQQQHVAASDSTAPTLIKPPSEEQQQQPLDSTNRSALEDEDEDGITDGMLSVSILDE